MEKGGIVKRVLALGSMLVLVLAFQNCGNQGLQAGGAMGGDVKIVLPQTGSIDEGSQVPAAKVTYVEIFDVAEPSSAQQKASDEITDTRLVISVQSGKIQLMDDVNNVLETRCLSAEKLAEMNAILAGSKICAAKVVRQPDQVCSMRMKRAYASLYADQQRVNLGEEFDACGTGRKDLCGELSAVFKAYVAHVKSSWADMSCQ